MSSTDPDPPRRSPADSPSLSQPRRPPQLDLFSTSAEDIHGSLPSPPYRPTPSVSNLYLSTYPEDSPAYRSRSNLDLITETSAMVGTKHEVHDRDSDGDDHPKASAKTARFTDDVLSPIHSAPPFKRVDSDYDFTRSQSRSPSIADTDDDEGDDYDWEAEEDLVDQEAKFEQNMGTATKRTWGFRRILALTFGSLVGSTLLSGLIITPALLVHFYWYKPHPNDHRRFVKDNVEAWLFWAAANLVISWYLALIIDIVPVVANYLLAIVWGHVSESVKTKTELYNSVKDTIKPLFYAASAWASWVIIFQGIYELYDMNDGSNSRAQYTNRIYDVVEFVFFFSLVICVQRMLSHAIAFAFHRTAYRERLEDIQKVLKVVEKLRVYKPKRTHAKAQSQGFGSRSFNVLKPVNMASSFRPRSRPGTPVQGQATHDRSRSGSPSPDDYRPSRQSTNETDDFDATLVANSKGKNKAKRTFLTHSPERADSEPITPPHHYRGSDRPGSPHAYPPKHTHREDDTLDVSKDVKEAAKTVAKTVKTAVLHDARNLEGRTDSDMGGLVWDVSSSHEAKRLARNIYTAFRSPTRTYLVPADFEPAFATVDDAADAFRVFDTDNNGDISRAEIKTTLLRVYKERRFLSRSMRDVGVALQTLDQILLFFALVVLFFISLSIFGVNVGNSLTSLYSLGIGLSFIFKNAASNAFDAIIFLFVTHPFDTGDRCFIDDENLVVKKMGLFATVFTRQDGTESYYFNSQLFNKFIINARRSDKTGELCSLSVDWRTPLAKLDELEKCLNGWLATEKNRWFQPSTGVALQNIKNMRHLEITIGIPHNAYELADWGLRLARKTAFHAAVQHYTRQLGITAFESSIPIVYVDPETQELLSYPGDDEYVDVSYDQDAGSQDSRMPPGAPHEGATRPPMTTLGFEPPPDGPGVRPRKSRGRKVGMRPLGADG